MGDSRWNEFEHRVSVEELLHVAAEPLAWPLPPGRALALAERNSNTLVAIAALEERRADGSDDDTPLMQEMRRMDAKLTALVEIVNQLLTPTETLPTQRLVRFNARGAVIPTELVPAGDAMLLSLRFDHCRSLSLELPAQRERQLENGRTFVAFIFPNDAQSDAIERLVFRHHRRKVAETRQTP